MIKSAADLQLLLERVQFEVSSGSMSVAPDHGKAIQDMLLAISRQVASAVKHEHPEKMMQKVSLPEIDSPYCLEQAGQCLTRASILRGVNTEGFDGYLKLAQAWRELAESMSF
jgi:hypothetical protein